MLPEALALALTSHGLDPKKLRAWSPVDGAFRLDVKGTEAMDVWFHLRAAHAETDHWPVVVGPPAELAQLEAQVAFNEQPATEILAAADRITADEAGTYRGAPWLRGLGLDVPAIRTPPVTDDEGGDTEDFDPPRWPADDELVEAMYVVPFDLEKERPHRTVSLLLLPLADPWQVPALLKFGGFDRCPPPHHHVALLRTWHERWGTEPACVTHDTLECRVTRPPATREEALDLAAIHHGYSDAQAPLTTEQVAMTLLRAPTWHFWWE